MRFAVESIACKHRCGTRANVSDKFFFVERLVMDGEKQARQGKVAKTA